MLEITEFNKDKLKNASQKLYKICLEKGEATPEYSIHNKITNQGNVYEAQCKALGLVGIGTNFAHFLVISSFILYVSIKRLISV